MLKKLYNNSNFKYNFLSFYLATIAASSTFDFVAISTPIGNLKVAFILTLPLIININYKELLSFVEKQSKIIAFLISLMSISFYYSHDYASSLKWTIQLFLDLALLIIFYSSLLKLKRIDKILKVALLLICIPGLIQYICILLNINPYFLTQTHIYYYRLNGLSYFPNFFSLSIFLYLPFFIYKDKFIKTDFIMIFLSSFLIIQSTSRTGVLTLLLNIILLAYLCIFKKKSYIYPLSIIILAILISLFLPEKTINNKNFNGNDKLIYFANEVKLTPSGSPLERVFIAKQGLRVFLLNPTWGVGPLAYESYINANSDKIYQKVFSGTMRNGLYISHENIWIELLANNGIIFTLSIFALILHFCIKRLYHSNNNIIHSSIISIATYYFITGQFVQNILFPGVFVIWSLVLYNLKYENFYNNSDI